MSDVELRDLERRWRASGTVEDEARWHVARVRAGALEPARLALAAWTGWPAAVLAAEQTREAPPPPAPPLPTPTLVPRPSPTPAAEPRSWLQRLLGRAPPPAPKSPPAPPARPGPAPPPPGPLQALSRWLEDGLRDAPREAQRRAALAEVERVLGLVAGERRRRGPPEELLRPESLSGCDPTTTWLVAAHAALRDGADAARDATLAGGWAAVPDRLRQLDRPPREAPPLVALAWEPLTQALRDASSPGGLAWWGAYAGPLGDPRTSPDALAAWAEAARAAQRSALAPWALGLADPLRPAPALDALEVASPCEVAWEGMRPVDADGRVRACDRCRLQVHDLSALSRAEAEALLAAHAGQRLCVRLYRRADGRVQTRDCGAGVGALVARAPRRAPVMGAVRAPR